MAGCRDKQAQLAPQCGESGRECFRSCLHRFVRPYVPHSGTVASSAFGERRSSLRLPINA
jgi:hypothetical protein